MRLFVLIIEDRPLHAKLFSGLLRAEGHQTVTALTGKEGLGVAESVQADLIIVDILLPDIDGHEVIAELRRRPKTANTPILAVSAMADRKTEQTCRSLGANSFLSKPMRVHTFSEHVLSLCS